MVETSRNTFNLHPGGMIFGADITLDRVLNAERLPQALTLAIEHWFSTDQISAITIGESLEQGAPSQFWEWQAVLVAHDIGIYTAARNAAQAVWINTEMYWHDPQFSGSQIEAIFVPDLAENQALATATEGNPPTRIAAMFIICDPQGRIEVAYGIMTTHRSRLEEIDLSNLNGRNIKEQVAFDTANADLLYKAYQKCREKLTED